MCLNIDIKHVFICSNPCIYTTVVQEVYNRDRSQEVDDVDKNFLPLKENVFILQIS
jgi:hypothetical protein